MRGTSILLIDLENFFLGREDNYLRSHPGELYDAVEDIESLLGLAIDLASPRRLIVRRAYANFNVRRSNESSARVWDYYLATLPQRMMELGIEPIQVFRLPGGGNKNAADMRLAMDAASLVDAQSAVEQVIIVSGDGDFIPVILELRSRGAEAVGVGVKHSTKKVVEKYFDRFEYFEELIEAHEIETESVTHLEPIRDALHRLLKNRGGSIKFAAIKPLLAKTLGHFDPTRFDCDNTGDFLRRYAGELTIDVRQGEFDWEILPIGEDGAVVEVVPGTGTRAAGAPPRREQQHSAATYRRLLRQRGIFMQPLADWLQITNLVFRIAGGDGGARPQVDHQTLQQEVSEQCDQNGMDDAAKRVKGTLFQVFKAGCFMCVDEEEQGQRQFKWTRSAVLAPEIGDVETMREQVHRFLLGMLNQRVGHVQGDQFAELLFGAETGPDEVAYVELLIKTIETMAPAQK